MLGPKKIKLNNCKRPKPFLRIKLCKKNFQPKFEHRNGSNKLCVSAKLKLCVGRAVMKLIEVDILVLAQMVRWWIA